MFYADINGSSPVYPVVEKKIQHFLQEGIFANPNASHLFGKKLLGEIEDSRKTIARILQAKTDQVIFNSGSSEGISHVFFSLLHKKLRAGLAPKVIISRIEHSCVMQAASYYESLGVEILWVKAAMDGVISLEQVQGFLENNPGEIAFVCVMAANNETGVIQPLEMLGELCQKYQVPLVCDTTQFIGKKAFSFSQLGVDFAFCSSHKIGALIGSGFILAKDPSLLSEQFIFGGGQERNLRGGTQNYVGISTMACALEYFEENQEKLKDLEKRKKLLEKKIKDKAREYSQECLIFGEDAPRLAGTSFWGLPKIPGFIIQEQLQRDNIFVSTTSACSDAKQQGSRVLLEMGYAPNVAKSAVRLSFCLHQGEGDFRYLEEKILKTIH